MRVPKELKDKVLRHYAEKERSIRQEYNARVEEALTEEKAAVLASQEWKEFVAAAKTFEKSIKGSSYETPVINGVEVVLGKLERSYGRNIVLNRRNVESWAKKTKAIEKAGEKALADLAEEQENLLIKISLGKDFQEVAEILKNHGINL